MIGKTLGGKYDIAELLGKGGMGAVYRAVHRATGRRVAVKVITAALDSRPGLVARFEREARAAGAIETQHIVQVLDAGTDAELGIPYMVMEYLVGEDLQQLIQRLGPLPPELALRITAQACLGLVRAHEAGVVHRDIKPANIFLARPEEGERVVKLLDFGIARVKMDELAGDQGTLTATGSLLGSPLYMSPEQALGLKDIDAQTDVWSLGVVLYEALCGRSPNGHIVTLGQIIMAICNLPATPLAQVAPWVASDIAGIAHRALQPHREQRTPSSAAMLAELRALLPNGWSIREDALVPLPAAPTSQAAAPAAQVVVTPAPAPPSSQIGWSPPYAPTHEQRTPPPAAAPAARPVAEPPANPQASSSDNAVSADRNLAQSQPGAPRRVWPIVVAIGVVGLAAAATVVGVTRSQRARDQAPITAASATTVAVAPASAPPAVAPANSAPEATTGGAGASAAPSADAAPLAATAPDAGPRPNERPSARAAPGSPANPAAHAPAPTPLPRATVAPKRPPATGSPTPGPDRSFDK